MPSDVATEAASVARNVEIMCDMIALFIRLTNTQMEELSARITALEQRHPGNPNEGSVPRTSASVTSASVPRTTATQAASSSLTVAVSPNREPRYHWGGSEHLLPEGYR